MTTRSMNRVGCCVMNCLESAATIVVAPSIVRDPNINDARVNNFRRLNTNNFRAINFIAARDLDSSNANENENLFHDSVKMGLTSFRSFSNITKCAGELTSFAHEEGFKAHAAMFVFEVHGA